MLNFIIAAAVCAALTTPVITTSVEPAHFTPNVPAYAEVIEGPCGPAYKWVDDQGSTHTVDPDGQETVLAPAIWVDASGEIVAAWGDGSLHYSGQIGQQDTETMAPGVATFCDPLGNRKTVAQDGSTTISVSQLGKMVLTKGPDFDFFLADGTPSYRASWEIEGAVLTLRVTPQEKEPVELAFELPADCGGNRFSAGGFTFQRLGGFAPEADNVFFINKDGVIVLM